MLGLCVHATRVYTLASVSSEEGAPDLGSWVGRWLAARHITGKSSEEVLSFGGKGRQVSGPATDLQGPWRCEEAVVAVRILNIC